MRWIALKSYRIIFSLTVVGLHQKTKELKISKGKENVVKIHIEVTEIEQVREFCYLGSMITTDAKCHREVKRKIAMGKETFSKRVNS